MFDLNKFASNVAVETEQGVKYSYADLDKNTTSIVSKMESRKLTFCLCGNTVGSLTGYVGFMAHNVPAVLLDGSKDMEIIQGLVDRYDPQYLWMPISRVSDLGKGNVITIFEDYSLVELNKQKYEINSDLLLCLTTSGTTGSPKLVKLTEENLSSNAEAIAEYLNITSSERAITSLPMYYSFGLSVINSHLIKGATILLTDKSIIQREFLTFLKKGKATSIAGVPYTYEMLKRLRFMKMELPELKTMIQAGGKLNAKIAKEYIDNAKATDKQFIVM